MRNAFVWPSEIAALHVRMQRGLYDDVQEMLEILAANIDQSLIEQAEAELDEAMDDGLGEGECHVADLLDPEFRWPDEDDGALHPGDRVELVEFNGEVPVDDEGEWFNPTLRGYAIGIGLNRVTKEPEGVLISMDEYDADLYFPIRFVKKVEESDDDDVAI